MSSQFFRVAVGVLLWTAVTGVQAADSPPVKLEGECHLLNLEFQKTRPEKTLTKPASFCVSQNGRSLLAVSYRNLNVMTAAAFLDQRLDIRTAAMGLLEDYRCENELACDRFRELLDFYIKATALVQKQELLERARKLKQDHPEPPEKKPWGTGLCAARPEVVESTARWLEQGYDAYCPAPPFVRGLSETWGMTAKAFEHDLEYGSGQAVMSSSYLAAIEHQGKGLCKDRWKAIVRCGVVKESARRVFDCAKREGKTQCAPR